MPCFSSSTTAWLASPSGRSEATGTVHATSRETSGQSQKRSMTGPPSPLERRAGDVELRVARELEPAHAAGDTTFELGVAGRGRDRHADSPAILHGSADLD